MNIFSLRLALILMSLALFCGFTKVTQAEEPVLATNFQEEFFRAEVDSLVGLEMLKVRIVEGIDQGKLIEIPYEKPTGVAQGWELEVGDDIIVAKTTLDGQAQYRFFERNRLMALWILLGLFVLIMMMVSGKKGVGSLLGLAVTFLILTQIIVPQIIAGANPVLVSFLGSVLIACCSLFLAHGFNRRTFLSLLSTLFTLVIAFAMAMLAVSFAQLFGLGSDEAVNLTLSQFGNIDLRGLFLGAMVIGVLGILDDVTTAQTATVEELHKANQRLGMMELYRRGISVGQEHIASLVNTLVIAYAGASFPIFLFINTATQPLWVIFNNETMAEEVVRSLVGSATLILAVPISTLLASWFYAKGKA
jgi:uncharacterized membrane protein